MITRSVAGVDQTLTWDPEGHLAQVADATGTVQTAAYDPSGTRFFRHTGNDDTLFLPDGTQVTDTAGTLTAQRPYQFAGIMVAVRTGPGHGDVTTLMSDPHGTAHSAVGDAAAAEGSIRPVMIRRETPYGTLRADPTGWPSSKGFVGGVNDTTTGLVQIGARPYDPALGAFITDDPITNGNDTRQVNGYVYANANPVTGSDPSGLYAVEPGGDPGRATHLTPYDSPASHMTPSAASSSSGGESWATPAGPNGTYTAAQYHAAQAAPLLNEGSDNYQQILLDSRRVVTVYEEQNAGPLSRAGQVIVAGTTIIVGGVVILATTAANVAQGGSDPATDGLEFAEITGVVDAVEGAGNAGAETPLALPAGSSAASTEDPLAAATSQVGLKGAAEYLATHADTIGDAEEQITSAVHTYIPSVPEIPSAVGVSATLGVAAVLTWASQFFG